MTEALRRYRRPLEIGVFAHVPAIALLWLGWFVYGNGGGGDFAIFRKAGRAILDGHSPYVRPTLKLLAANDRFVYPTPFALPFIPFAFVPEKGAAILFLVLSAAALLVSVWLLEVRDWRCYGASLLGLPAFGALGVGAIGPLLVLLCALGWRWRNRTVAGVPLALAAAAKLFLWPLLVWLLVTRRFRAFAAAVATIGATLAVWALIDPGGMRRYPETVRVLDEVQRWKSYSVQSLFISLHASALASDLAVGATAVVSVAAICLIRRRGDRASFSAAVVAALLATPILWMHYLVLLLLPIALARPRLSPLWLAPMVFWVTPHPESLGIVWRIVFVLVVLGLVTARTVIRPSVWGGSGPRLLGAGAHGPDVASPQV